MRFLPDSNREGEQEAELASCAESSSSLRRTDEVDCTPNHLHEHELVFQHAFEMHAWFSFLQFETFQYVIV